MKTSMKETAYYEFVLRRWKPSVAISLAAAQEPEIRTAGVVAALLSEIRTMPVVRSGNTANGYRFSAKPQGCRIARHLDDQPLLNMGEVPDLVRVSSRIIPHVLAQR
jgi:hypothetical protein